jgi:hypothetical protein
MVLNINFTISLCYEKELVAILTLLHDGIFWLFKQRHNVVDEKIYNVLVPFEYLIAIDSARKDV